MRSGATPGRASQGAFSGAGRVRFRVRNTSEKGVVWGAGRVPNAGVCHTPYPCTPTARVWLAWAYLFWGGCPTIRAATIKTYRWLPQAALLIFVLILGVIHDAKALGRDVVCSREAHSTRNVVVIQIQERPPNEHLCAMSRVQIPALVISKVCAPFSDEDFGLATDEVRSPKPNAALQRRPRDKGRKDRDRHVLTFDPSAGLSNVCNGTVNFDCFIRYQNWPEITNAQLRAPRRDILSGREIDGFLGEPRLVASSGGSAIGEIPESRRGDDQERIENGNPRPGVVPPRFLIFGSFTGAVFGGLFLWLIRAFGR